MMYRTTMMNRVFVILLFFGTTVLSASEPVERERLFLCKDMPYVTGGGERQQLDLYIPKIDGKIPTAANPVPVIVWIHWGSWKHGSKDPCIPLGLTYTQKGYALASINYRLIGTDPFPAQLEDCKSAVRWLRANADKYGLDTKHIGAWGVSAGGHLAALLGTTGDVKEFDVGENLNQSSAVQCVCDLFGPADLPSILEDPRSERFLTDEASSVYQFLGGSLKDKMDLAYKATPTFHVKKGNAPFLIFHGNKDWIVPIRQSERLHEELKKAGVESEFVVIDGVGHGAVGFLTPEVLDKIERFFAKHLKENPSAR
jgi:acetyl esterase/lipase